MLHFLSVFFSVPLVIAVLKGAGVMILLAFMFFYSRGRERFQANRDHKLNWGRVWNLAGRHSQKFYMVGADGSASEYWIELYQRCRDGVSVVRAFSCLSAGALAELATFPAQARIDRVDEILSAVASTISARFSEQIIAQDPPTYEQVDWLWVDDIVCLDTFKRSPRFKIQIIMMWDDIWTQATVDGDKVILEIAQGKLSPEDFRSVWSYIETTCADAGLNPLLTDSHGRAALSLKPARVALRLLPTLASQTKRSAAYSLRQVEVPAEPAPERQ